MCFALLIMFPLLLSTIPAHRASRSLPVIVYPTGFASHQNKSERVAYFSPPKNHHATHHDLPANHHKLTTKNHAFSLAFSQNPPAKTTLHHPKKNSLHWM